MIERYLSLSPKNRETIDRARMGRELARMTIEDAAVTLSPTEFIAHVKGAARKAWPRETATGILEAMGEDWK